MALNSSGPISLGGATTGESINLELGNAATAVASIDSAPFRTLANVPSGTITLSNFYGKSSNSYWALTGAISTFYNGFSVSVNGILCLGGGGSTSTATSREFYFFNPEGTLVKSTALNPDFTTGVFVESYANNNSTSAPIFYGITNRSVGSGYGFSAFNHTTNTNLFGNNWRRPRVGGTIGYTDNSLLGIFADASNNIYVVPKSAFQPLGKSSVTQIAYASYTSDGTLRYSYATTGNNNTAVQFQNGNIAALRSDNTLVVAGVNPTSSLGLYTVNTTTGIASANFFLYNNFPVKGDGLGQVLIDSSNNVYVCRPAQNSLPTIFKLDSSYSIVAAKYYTLTTGAAFLSGWWSSAAMYNDTIYIFTTTGVSNSLSVLSVNSSTLAPIWSLRVSFTGVSSTSPDFMDQGQAAIKATSVGIYIALIINRTSSPSTFNTCVMKLPLDGNISGAKTIALSYGGGTCTASNRADAAGSSRSK